MNNQYSRKVRYSFSIFIAIMFTLSSSLCFYSTSTYANSIIWEEQFDYGTSDWWQVTENENWHDFAIAYAGRCDLWELTGQWHSRNYAVSNLDLSSWDQQSD